MTTSSNQEKTPEEQRQDRINAREQAAAEARAARLAERQSWRDARRAEVVQRRETIKQNNAQRLLTKENKDLDKLLVVCDGLSVKAVRGRDINNNVANKIDRNVMIIDMGIQANQQAEQNITKIRERSTQELTRINQTRTDLSTQKNNKISTLVSLENDSSQAAQRQKVRLQKEIFEIEKRIAILNSREQFVNVDRDVQTAEIAKKASKILELEAKRQAAIAEQQKRLQDLLTEQEEWGRQQERKRLADLRRNDPERRPDCICATVYDPVIINGKTYGNKCEAECAGVTVPPNAPKPPQPEPPGGRICLQVITCGSDGNTYPTSCLPVGVYPVKRGGSCEGLNIDEEAYKKPSTRPPVLLAANLVINR